MNRNKTKKIPRTLPAGQRKQQLIDAAITIISKRGISGTTLTAVTKEAGLSLGLVNFHFTNKDGLLSETLRFLAEEHRAIWLSEQARTDLSARDKLLAIVEAQFAQRICTRKKLSVWFAFFGDTQHRQSYRKTSSEIDQERLEVCASLCQRIAEEENMEGIDHRAIARSLEGLFDGLWLNMLMYPDQFTREDSAEMVRSFLTTALPEAT